jgi:enamine deaminase RidA (YjgF/YER057c/UK114 family)
MIPRAILRPVERHSVPAVSPQAAVVGYSRAVRTGELVFVAGTAPVMPEGAEPPPDAYGQARRCLEIIAGALADVGASPRHVVRTRIYVTRPEIWEEVGRAHGELFADVRPATSMVVVAGLLDPRWLVEIEADAVVR